MKDYYSILGVSISATPVEIRTAYINRSRILHPDRFDPQKQPKEWKLANEMMKELNEAYDILKDAELRAEYDDTLNAGKRQQEEKKHTESEFSETRAESKTDRKPQPKKGATVAYFHDLPQETKTFIFSQLRSGSSPEFYKIRIEGILSKYLFVAVILFGFYILYTMAHDSQWSSTGNFFALAASCVGSVYLFRKSLWIYKWHKSQLKCFYYLTPLFFIKTYLNEIRYWWAWDIEDIRTTHHYKNKNYQKTSVDIVFKDATEKIIFSSQAEWLKFSHALKELEDARLKAAAQQAWAWFDQLNFFHRVKGCSTQEIERKKKREKKISRFLFGTAILVGGFFYFSVYDINKDYSSEAINRYASREPTPATTPVPAPAEVTDFQPVAPPVPVRSFDKPAKPLPQNGYLKRFTTEDPIAPLKIQVPEGDTHYYVKIVHANTTTPVATIFIRAGQSVRLKVPLGSYEIKYAMGTTWYGTKYLFGPETTVAKAEKTFDFRIDGDKVNGYTIELIKQQGGNLHTSNISLEDF
jgi:DnaJ-domain-containing protein 1